MSRGVSVARGAEWAARFWESRRESLDFQGCSLVAFALACAARSLPVLPDAPQAALEGVLARLGDLTETGEGDAAFEQGSGLITLMAAAASVGLPGADERFARFGARRSMECAPVEPLAPADELAAATLCALLRGEAATSVAVALDAALLADDAPYRLDSDAILDLATRLGACSLFGRRRPALSPAEEASLCAALPFWSFYFVKKRDLDMVAPLVRALAYMGWHSEAEFGEAVGYVARQQQPDGRFGRHDLESHRLALTLGPDFDAERHLYLSLTASSLWTLALAEPTARPLFGEP